MKNLVKESYKLSMKQIRYELSLDYENGVEKSSGGRTYIIFVADGGFYGR